MTATRSSGSPGQDYRMADAIHAARTQPTRNRQGPERIGPER
jgi:hypothetical protein